MSEPPQRTDPKDRILAETPYLRFIDRGGWYFVERPSPAGVVVIVAVTPADELVLIEQHRASLGRWILELPAGLVGDDHPDEPLLDAAGRELVEETGWQADRLEVVTSAASAPGLTSEVVTYVRATGLKKVGAGGGVGGEQIRVHQVPLARVSAWVAERTSAGALASTQLYGGLWLALDRETG
jgi:ADP-ribose pyrophosphatase